mgnify:CR=1 FL=1
MPSLPASGFMPGAHHDTVVHYTLSAHNGASRVTIGIFIAGLLFGVARAVWLRRAPMVPPGPIANTDDASRQVDPPVADALPAPADTFIMPDLVYRRYEPVRRYFEGGGFRLGAVKFEPYEGISDGTILRQNPLPGHPLRRRDVISLVVAATQGALP